MIGKGKVVKITKLITVGPTSRFRRSYYLVIVAIFGTLPLCRSMKLGPL
jgi:hypothetical protein